MRDKQITHKKFGFLKNLLYICIVMEEIAKYKSYLENYTTKVQELNSKVNGTNNEEYSIEERELARAIYDKHLDELRSEI